MKKNILVFPCGSEIGLEIYKSLSYSTHFELFGASSTDDHGQYVYKNYIKDIPFVDSANFIERINEIVDEYKIDFIIPAHDSVVLKLAQQKAAGKIRCEVLTSPAATCEIARSKLATYQTLSSTISVPKVYEVDKLQASDFPIFLKPEVGQGSKGTHIAKTVQEVEFYKSKDPSLLALEYLPGKEYTVDCFTSSDGKLRFSEGRERIRIMNGISVSSEAVDDPRITPLTAKINEKIQFTGVWFFQVKENQQGELVLMEIAPRVAGTMGLVRCKGVNLVLLSLFDALGYNVSISENNYSLAIDRALENRYRHDIKYSHVYLDFDDLVIFEGKINPTVMAFVFQCLNKNVKIHLLTRHRSDLEQTLKQYRLTGIFDELIWIKEEDEKYEYVTEKEAIFIDDSFAERNKVSEQCRIPVFDAHMLEALMETP